MLEAIKSIVIDIAYKISDHFDIFLPAMLTIVGWQVVYVQGRRLAKRNEVYNLFKSARSAIESLNVDSEKIWKKTQADLDEFDGIKLLAYIGELERCKNTLKLYYDFEIEITSTHIFQLRRLATAYPYYLDGGKKLNNLARIKSIRERTTEFAGILMDSTYKCINSKYS